MSGKTRTTGPKKRSIASAEAPPPAGTYSQAIAARGEMVFIAGQTPRNPDGTRLPGGDFRAEATRAMQNVDALAKAAGCNLPEHCVHATVYLKDLADRFVFDEVFASFVGDIPPARAIVQSNFTDFTVEISAILVR